MVVLIHKERLLFILCLYEVIHLVILMEVGGISVGLFRGGGKHVGTGDYLEQCE